MVDACGVFGFHVMAEEHVLVRSYKNESIGMVGVYQEEEQRMRRVASNIAKDVKKFWLKVDKLVRNRSVQAGWRYERIGSDEFDVLFVW